MRLLTNSQESDTAEILYALLIEIKPMMNSEIVPESLILRLQVPWKGVNPYSCPQPYILETCSDLIRMWHELHDLIWYELRELHVPGW